MRFIKKSLSILLSLVSILSVIACPLLSSDSLALESTGNAIFDAFINDSRWTHGAAWPNGKHPMGGPENDPCDTQISSWISWTCCAYVADFVKYCYGSDNPFPGNREFHNAYDIQAGDVIRLGAGNSTHYFAVLKRDGNRLYTADGNWIGPNGNRIARVGWNFSIIDGNRISGHDAKFADGAGFHWGTPSGGGGYGGGSSFPTKKFEPSDDYYAAIIRPDVWKPLDLASNNNVQITNTSFDSDPSRLWRFEKQSDGSYAIFNQKNGYCLDAYNAGTSNGTNVIAYSNYTGAKNQRWFLYDSGAGTVIKSAGCDLVLDCTGGYSDGGTNIQLWEYNGTQAQRFSVYVAAKRTDLDAESADAYLIREKPWLHIENSSNRNVQISATGNNSLDPKQIWHYQKQPDESYCFSTAYTISYTSEFLTADSSTANVLTATQSAINDVKNFHWYVYKYQPEYGDGLVFRVKGREQVLTCNNGASTAGTNIIVSSFNNTQGQRFIVWHLSNDKRTYTRPDNPIAPILTAPSSAVAGENISLSWTASPLKSSDYDTRAYRVEILEGSNVIKQLTTTSLTSTVKIDTEGTYSIRVRAINTKYPGDAISSVSAAKTITITPAVKSLTASMVSNIPDQEYTGSEITPEIVVKDGAKTLVEGTDYTVAYSNNIDAGEAKITITGNGKYAGTVTVRFNIVKIAYTITINQPENGTASLSKSSAYIGDEIIVAVKPDLGYELYGIYVNNKLISGNKFTMPASDTTVRVLFGKKRYSVTVNYDHLYGSVFPSKNIACPGERVTLNIYPNYGYVVDTVKVNGKVNDGFAFIMSEENVIIDVTFKKRETGIISGKCNDKVSWTLDTNGILTITGSGTFTGIDWGYREGIKTVVFDGNITAIGNSAFDQCSNLRNITLPGTVKTIGSSAFADCNQLRSINIPDGVSTIKSHTFLGTNGMSIITIPASVKTIEDGAFHDCNWLQYIYYSGSENEWKNIDIGTDNDVLKRSPVRYGVANYSISVNSDGNGIISLSKTTANVGDEIIVTVTPAAGYALDTIKVNGTPIVGNRFAMPDRNTIVNVTFKKSDYKITINKTGEGTAILSKTSANAGDEITVTATPDAGYTLGSIKVNGTALDGSKFDMPAKDTTVEIVFVKIDYTVSISKDGEGKVSLSKTSANVGDEVTVTATPATGYKLGSIKVNGTEIDGNKFEMPAKNTTVKVIFIKEDYTVSVRKTGEGTVNISKTSANYGDEITVTATPDSGYVLGTIKVNGAAIDGNKFEMPDKNTIVEVTFKKVSYSITVKKNGEGTVKLSKTTANADDKITIEATPAEGYEISSIKVNDSEITGNKFTMPAKNTTVEVTFSKIIMSHELTKVDAKFATCTNPGNTAYYICKDPDCGCGKSYSDKYGQHEIDIKDTVVPATGHNLEKVAAKEATCTESGHLAYWKCNKCGKLFKDANGEFEITAANVVIDPLGHDTEHVEHIKKKDSTYKEDGHEDYYLCPRCGKKFSDPECKKPVTDAELLIPKKGAAVQGEEANVGDFNYRVTYQATDGTGTVTLIGVDNKTASVVIPSNVEIKGNTYKVNRIGPSAFSRNTEVTSVYIGANVVIIDNNAFMGCSKLVKVSGGAGLKTIGTKAFASCPKLKTFVITSKVLWKIGSYSFYGDKSLKTIYIKNTVKVVKSGVKKSLKGSKIKTVKVKKSKVKKYKKYFKKSNSGRKVKVKR